MKITSKLYQIIFLAILLFGFVTRIIPVLSNNFHFTMDQGNDAVYVREIVERGQFPLVGPETNISGFYSGALWYYFLSIGYILFNGHPMYAVILLIILNLVTTIFVVKTISEKLSPEKGLIVGFALQIFWWFYDVSRYGFNPFPLVALTITVVILLTHCLEKTGEKPLIVALLCGLAFHTEMAGATALAIFSFTIMFFFAIKNYLSWKKYLICILISLSFFIPHLIYEAKNHFYALSSVKNALFDNLGILTENRFQRITVNFIDMILNSATPRRPQLSLIVWVLTLIIALKSRIWEKNKFVTRFSILSFIFIIISWLFFGSNTGWRIWHTVAIPPLIFISLLSIVLSLPSYTKITILTIILTFQLTFFIGLYSHFLNPLDDQSLLKNELQAVDWIYENSQGIGFYVYNYLPSVRDYSHQYLFWWRGKNKYGYLPCEYSRYPSVPSFYIPGYKYYQSPQKSCSNLRFLIIEPDQNETILNQWYKGVTEKTKLLDTKSFGKITVEKRKMFP